MIKLEVYTIAECRERDFIAALLSFRYEDGWRLEAFWLNAVGCMIGRVVRAVR